MAKAKDETVTVDEPPVVSRKPAELLSIRKTYHLTIAGGRAAIVDAQTGRTMVPEVRPKVVTFQGNKATVPAAELQVLKEYELTINNGVYRYYRREWVDRETFDGWRKMNDEKRWASEEDKADYQAFMRALTHARECEKGLPPVEVIEGAVQWNI